MEAPRIPSSEITPEAVYRSRRNFMAGLGAMAAAVTLSGCSTRETLLRGLGATDRRGDVEAMTRAADSPSQPQTQDELGHPATSFGDITGYNNYYEFTTHKQGVARMAQDFQTSPWELQVGGLVHHPRTFGLEDLMGDFDQEDRVYRLRCVEGWSMVIPWRGLPLAALLAVVEPKAEAQYVRFETLHDPERFPGQRSRWLEWPYVEGLRLDEAMHPLTLLVTGLYGQDLPAQNGAPLRLAVPWKYGFKSIKAIVKIDLVSERPRSLWMIAAPREYGFYANVNPDVAHPRWSQATERRIGEGGRRRTLPFNGYEAEVAGLYAGMDLKSNF